MATLVGRISAGLVSFHRTNLPLYRALQQVKCKPMARDGLCVVLTRGMAAGKAPKFFIKAPDYADRRLMRKFVRYLAYTGVPLLGLITCVNVFVGPAKLIEIPEGYEPKHWEYFEHPIERWFARYVYPNPQKDYEKKAHYMEDVQMKKEARAEMVAVKKLMKERGDGYYSFVRSVPKQDYTEEDA